MRFRHILLAAAALAVEFSLLSLAHWQWNRYHQRLSEAAAFAVLSPTTYTGTFTNAQTVALDNQPNPQDAAQQGWRILTPFQTPSETFIVDRGWAPAVFTAPGTPSFAAFTTSATIIRAIPQPILPRHGWLQGPAYATHPKLLTLISPSLITSATVSTSYLLAQTPTGGIQTPSPPELPDPNRHLGYAIQWLGMAVIFILLCVARIRAVAKRPRRRK